jgi:hypothetical protein
MAIVAVAISVPTTLWAAVAVLIVWNIPICERHRAAAVMFVLFYV